MDRKHTLPPLLAAALILLTLSAASLLAPDRTFSDNENRYLQQAPVLTGERVFSGKFGEEAEKYESDQIVLRDFWMGVASSVRRLLGKQDIGGVYLGRDGYYFARLTEEEFDQRQFEKNLAAVEEFFTAHADADCRILLAPSPGTVLAEKLPDGAPMYDASSRFAQLDDALGDRVVDVRRALGAVPQPYYRTDHHWTTAGAQAACGVWREATGRAAPGDVFSDEARVSASAASRTFRGTLYSKVLLPDSAYDTIYLPLASIRSMNCDGTVTDSLYDEEKLGQKDQYAVFMGGNWAQVDIDTGTEAGGSLLVIKDSFANCFVPFLTEDFESITMLDLRFFNGSLPQLMAERQITDVLVLYELSNFASDSHLFKLNEE